MTWLAMRSVHSFARVQKLIDRLADTGDTGEVVPKIWAVRQVDYEGEVTLFCTAGRNWSDALRLAWHVDWIWCRFKRQKNRLGWWNRAISLAATTGSWDS